MPEDTTANSPTESWVRSCMAGFLAWLVPGLGHLYIGERRRGTIFLVTIAATFWTGVAVGGVRGTVHPQQRKAWFMAEICAGGHALAAYGLHRAIGLSEYDPHTRQWTYVGHFHSIDVGVVYAAVAGLLNVLIIMDAVARSQGAPGTAAVVPLPERLGPGKDT